MKSTYLDEPVSEISMRFVDFCVQRMDILLEVTNVPAISLVLMTECTWLKMVDSILLRGGAKVWW